MFEGLITNVLNRVLGDFIEGIKADQLNISLLSGDVELKNLSIKPTILDSMPLPFKIRYGKVGRLFVDIPVTSLLSSPLKIEISDIFMLINPKEVEEWNEEVIKNAFVAGVQSQLQGLEDTFKAQLEIQNAEPGMAGNMINKIIDNIQIDIKNICFRLEDSTSNKKVPYALGIHLEALQLYTCNERWERDFVSGEDISLKMAKITNFELYLNFSKPGQEDEDGVSFGEFEEDMNLSEVVQDQLNQHDRNRNLIEKFCIEARIRLNKNPKKNNKPMVDINLVIGGKFMEGRNELVDSEEGIGFFKLQKQQMNCILKYLDYSTNYTKFQTGVQKNLLSNKFSREESQEYMKIYEEYKMLSGDNKSAGEKKKAAKLRERLKDIEVDYAYETIAAIRQISINKYNLEFRKEQERESMHLKIKQFENERAEGYLSNFWGGKSEEEKLKDEQEIEQFKDKLNKEFDGKFKNEEEKIDEKMDSLLENEPIFDQEALKNMPNEWTQFLANIVIPKLRIVLLDEDSTLELEKSIMEIQMSGMKTKAQIGQDWQEIDLSSGKLNIIDNVTGSDIYQFMIETVFPGNQPTDGKDSFLLHFENNPRYEDGEMKIKLYTKAHQYIFANMCLIKELQEFFAGGDSPEEQVDLSYYTDRAKIKALEYMNAGADYLEESQQDIEYVHKGIDVDIELFAPVLVVPESITDLRNKKTLVLNLGYLRMTSDIRPYHKEVDYLVVNRGEELFDKYDLKISGLQLSMIEELVDYKRWQDAPNKIDIINDITINMNINRSIEPNHPNFPTMEVFCKIMKIDIFASDYVLANLTKIQGALSPPPAQKVEEVVSPDTHPPKAKKKEKPGASLLRKLVRNIEEESKNDDDEEDNEGEENIENEENDNINETRSISAKSKTEVDENPENKILKIDRNMKSKVDQRILIIFDKMTITLGEVVPLNVAHSSKYEGVIDVLRSDIPHVNILEMAFEGLEVEYNTGKQQALNLVMNRFYVKDLQKIRKIEDGIEQEAAPLIPECYQMVLSNPEIEKEFDDEASFYTMNSANLKTEDFKSLKADEESIIDMDQNVNSLAQLKVAVRMFGPCTDVDFLFSNLRLIVTLPILERLSKFQNKMNKLKEENTQDFETKTQILQMIEESDSEESEDDFEVEKDTKLKRAAMYLIDQEKKKQEETQEEKGYLERLKEERNRYLMKGKKLKIKILNQINKMSARGKLCNFDIWVPLDSLDKHSRVLSLELSSHVGYRASTFTRHKINEITSEMIESKLIRNQQDANVVVTQLCISMINRHLLEIQGELTQEKILLPTRIDLSYDKFLHTLKETDITNIEIVIEPIDLKVGFREIDNFKKLGEVMGEFSARISSPQEEEQKVYPQEGQEGIEAFKETQQIGIDKKEITEAIEEEVKATKRKIAIKDRRIKEFIKMKVKLISESINLALMDDTGSYEYPLVNFSINKILATVNQESGEDDAVNFILKKMGISKFPAMKVDAALLFEANYYNLDSGSYEPLIEPWTFNAMILQKTSTAPQEIKLSSDEMLNLNLTYGMALAVKRIQTKISQNTEQWEDEKKAEETKQKSKTLTGRRSLSKGKSTKRKTRVGEEDDEVAGFYFENHLGLGMRITLENHDSWNFQGIELTNEDEEVSVIQFQDWEDPGERNFRTLKEINTLNKTIKKKQNDGKLVESYAENIIRVDAFIDGFEPITGIPIEIAGRRSYELEFKHETEKQRKKNKYEFSITVNVSTEGIRKVVSFESQLTIVNKTEFDMEIAQVFTDAINKDETEISKQLIEEAVAAMRGEAKMGGQKLTRFDDIVPFDPVFAGSNFKVPLTWFIDEISIFYKCERGGNETYRRIMPNLKKLLLQKEDEDKAYEDLPKYHLLKQENIHNTFIALDVVCNKCRPTAMDRPPHYELTLLPPICLNNMTFSDITVYRDIDDKLMHVIKPGSYGYLYTGVEQDMRERDSSEEDEKIREREEMARDAKKQEDLYKGEVSLNQYKFKFLDDGNMVYASTPDYFYSNKKDYKFYPEDLDGNESQKEEEEPVTLTFEIIKFNTFIYTPYVIINKTDIPMKFGEKGGKKKCKMIAPHSNEFFNPLSSKKKKFSVCVENYEWAKEFDITTMGMSGEVSLKRQKEFDLDNNIVQKYNSNNLSFGVLISSLSSPYGKTTAVKFVPRYIFVNHCSKPLVLAQDNDRSLKQFYLNPEEEFCYNFENRGDKDNFIKIREAVGGDNLIDTFADYHEIEPTDWSSRFSIDDFEDFQISLKSHQREPEEEKKEVKFDEGQEGQEDTEKSEKKEPQWYEPSEINEFRRFVRVIITTKDEATLFVMLCDPNMPEYRINNFSGRTVKVYQDGIDHRAIMRTCSKATVIKDKVNGGTTIETYPIPFVWDDQTVNEKKIILEIDGQRKEYDLDEIKEKKDFVVKKKKYYIELISTGFFRELEIRDRVSSKNKAIKSKDLLKSLMVAPRNRTGMKANLDLRGLGISFVDKEPKEVLYISIFRIIAKIERETVNKGRGVIETSEEYDFMIYHFQIDNMVTTENSILFSPEEILDKEKILNDEEYTPFVQIKISYTNNESSKVSRKKIDALQVMIQKMKLEVETGALNVIINTVTEITGVFGDTSTEYLSAQTKGVEEKNALEGDKEIKKLGDAKSEGYATEKDDFIFKKEEVCLELSTTSPEAPELSSINTDKLYFNLIHLGAIKINISLKFEKRALNFDLNKGFGVLTILYTVATTIATVSDAPLSFSELVITNIFQSQSALISSLTKNYTRQGIFQFYKLIGSSDLLGNPVGFVDKLGSGVFEFFNEPRKGLIKGPKEFVGGVGKGVTSLVTGVVSASFDSVSKISGSLYNVAKNVTGQEAMLQKKSENALEGVADGVTGAGKELIGGVTGVFTKPFQGAKKEGVTGFAKGVGKGVLGLVVSPFTAVLRAGHSVTQGVTNTAIRIKKGKLPQYGRFRHPRYINARNILEPYDEDFAEVNQILIKIENGKYSKHSIRYFADFPIFNKKSKRSDDEATMILTEQTLLVCLDTKKMLYHTPLSDIKDINVYEGSHDSSDPQKILYHLYVYSKKNYVFETVNYSLIDRTYSILSKEAKNSQKIKEQKKKKMKK
ncbi:unnamed protein product [Moneuplotes crassus]|uniref:Uncharacterized protein n=2 Tax=Euplotes crassus TaxID=5936 RepID=A0AAD1U404_EUPCR|nr:unnamed protein product [Moneuplotes crassus]